MTDPGIPSELLAGVDVDGLVEAASAVRAHAHAPYSGYAVGAALLADDGRVFAGVNVENSAYPSCLCAEHNAVGTAVASGARRFRAVAIVTQPKPGAPPGAPCGKCRQVMAEFGLDLVVILAAPTGERVITTLRALLPLAFTAADLGSARSGE
ncbi:cytidine deaminase [Myxococcota bacterium]|nr:cytidine deaminase [Myxococcota bacterium]